MKATTNKQYTPKSLLQRIATNPSIIWLPFAVPFLLPLSAFMLYLGVAILIFVSFVVWRASKKRIYLWRVTLFIPLFLLLLSTVLTYTYFSSWHVVWSLFAIAISAGWLWHIEHILTGVHPFDIEEWIFSARLFGLGSLTYLLIYWIAIRYGFDTLLPEHLLPPILILVGILTHRIRLAHKDCYSSHLFSCPIGAPLVRMAIVCNDLVWLTSMPYTGCFVERGENSTMNCNPRHFKDHPITSCIGENEPPEVALDRAYNDAHLKLKEKPRFLLKYKYTSTSGVERTIYLYVLNLNMEPHATALSLRGCFYTPTQVEQMIHEGRFGKLFREEYIYLKQTLFLSNRLINQG